MADLSFLETDSNRIYENVISALEESAGEPLYPGDERRIFGDALVALFVSIYNEANEACKQKMLQYASGEVLDAIGARYNCIRIAPTTAKTVLRFSVKGKSTHSRMWLAALDGCLLLNDDHPVIRITDGNVIAYGSPWSGKTRCYKNLQFPVGGIIRIVRAPYNKAQRLSIIGSYASLMTSCSGMIWEKDLADGRDRTIQGIISAVPCYTMECLPNEDAAKVCSRAVMEV